MKIGDTKKLSAITMDDLENLGIKFIHCDASDALMGVSESHLHEIKSMLINRYGDFDVRAVSDQWGAKLEYLCEQFNNEKRAFYEKKKAWCEKYGCE